MGCDQVIEGMSLKGSEMLSVRPWLLFYMYMKTYINVYFIYLKGKVAERGKEKQ